MDRIRRTEGETTMKTSNKDNHRKRKEESGSKQTGWRVSKIYRARLKDLVFARATDISSTSRSFIGSSYLCINIFHDKQSYFFFYLLAKLGAIPSRYHSCYSNIAVITMVGPLRGKDINFT